MADAATLEFRATVAFLLEGVPHHAKGTWQPKKRDAQRDAAERALNLFVGKWGEEMVKSRPSEGALEQSLQTQSDIQLAAEKLLEEHCQRCDAFCNSPPTWSGHWEDDGWHPTVKLMLLGVPHEFAGAADISERAARADLAMKVLWYLRCPVLQDAYEPDPAAVAVVTRKIPPPPANWAHDSASEGALEVAERKTAIMRVQNRLQQTFSHQLTPGMSVWAWNYDVDPDDEDWPALSRASVNIPVIGKTFTGDWVRGQRDAQINAIRQVTSFLDELAGP